MTYWLTFVRDIPNSAAVSRVRARARPCVPRRRPFVAGQSFVVVVSRIVVARAIK